MFCEVTVRLFDCGVFSRNGCVFTKMPSGLGSCLMIARRHKSNGAAGPEKHKSADHAIEGRH